MHLRSRPAMVVLLVLGLGLAGLAFGGASQAVPTWRAVGTLSPAGVEADRVSVVADEAGNVTAVWEQDVAGTRQVHASRRTAAGAWTPPTRISPAVGSGRYAHAGVDASGTVTAVWRHLDGGVHRIQVARMSVGGVWGAPVDVAVGGAGEVYGDPRVAVSPRGHVAVVWELTEADLDQTVLAAQRSLAGAWSTPNPLALAGPSAVSPQIGVDDSGRAVALWQRNVGTPEDRITHAVQVAPGQWAAPNESSTIATSADTPVLAVNPAGDAVAVWRQYDGDDYRVRGAYRPAGGTWSAGTDLSADGDFAYAPAAVVLPSGVAVVAWERLDTIEYRSHTELGWGLGAAAVSDPGASEATLAVGTQGRTVLAWRQLVDGQQQVHATVRDHGQVWPDATPLTVPAADVDNVALSAAVSGSGDAVVAWERTAASNDSVQAAGLDGAGPVTGVRPLARWSTTTTLPLRWAAVDRWSPVASYDTRRRVSAWNRSPGSWASWLTGTTATGASSAVGPGTTTCVVARATDTALNAGPWSSPSCTTTPVDDRTARASVGWRKRTGRAHFARTLRVTTRKGATLTWRGAQGRSFALLVATGRGHGTVTVRIGRTRLATVRLRSAGTHRMRVIPLRTLPVAKSGRLVVTVVSRGKPVQVDGIYVAP